MAITPKYELEVINSQLRIRDITGIYGASGNLTGYGSPNTAIANVTYAALVLKDSANNTTTIELTTDFPDSLTYEGYFYYPLQDLPNIEDIYKVNYVIKDSTTTYTSETGYHLIAPITEAGLNSLYAKIEDKIADKDLTVYMNQVRFAFNLWETLKALATIGDNNNSRNIVKSINRLFTFNQV